MSTFFSCEQLSGISNIDFYLLEEVTNFPITLTDNNSAQLVFDLLPSNIIATVDEESFVEDVKPKFSTNGDIYEISLKFNFITTGQAIENSLNYYRNKPGIAIVTYYTDEKKLFGTDEEPLFMQFAPKRGSFITDKAHISVEITGVSRTKPVYYPL